MGHAHIQALVESAVLALVAVFLLDLALEVALVVLQLQPDGPPEETLGGGGGGETQCRCNIKNLKEFVKKKKSIVLTDL